MHGCSSVMSHSIHPLLEATERSQRRQLLLQDNPAMQSVRALDIPEILMLLGTHLTKAQLAAACRVCRAWFAPFAQELWSSLEEQDFKGTPLWALSKYSLYIRHLSCPLSLPLDHFHPGPSLTHLRTFQPALITLQNVFLVQEILQNNPSLRTLFIECSKDFHDEVSRGMVWAVAQLHGLTSLQFTTHWRLHSGSVEHLLNKLPMLHSFGVSARKGGEAIMTLRPEDVGGPSLPQRLSIRSLKVDLPWMYHRTMTKMLQACPLLESLEWNDSAYPYPGIPDLGQFAKILHASCPNLNVLRLSSYWVSQNLLHYVLSLHSPQIPITVPLPTTTAVRESHWIRLKSLHITNTCVTIGSILTAILAGRQVFEEILETIEVVGGPRSTLSLSGPREIEGQQQKVVMVVSILETFKRLCSLHVKNAVVPAQDFFHAPQSRTEGTRAKVRAEPGHLEGLWRLKSWASVDIVSLAFRIEGPDRHWCPPGVGERSGIPAPVPRQVEAQENGYPLYNLIKARLDGFAHLDQSQIRYQFP